MKGTRLFIRFLLVVLLTLTLTGSSKAGYKQGLDGKGNPQFLQQKGDGDAFRQPGKQMQQHVARNDPSKLLREEVEKLKVQPQEKRARPSMPQNVATSGRITVNGTGAGGYLVVAYDRDMGPGGILIDVPVGVAISRFDDPGCYSISYDPLLYAAQDMEDGRAVKPDIFVRVMSRPGVWRHSGLRIDVSSITNEGVDINLNTADLISPEELPAGVGLEEFPGWFLDEMQNDPARAVRVLLELISGHATHRPIDLGIEPGTGNEGERLPCVPKTMTSAFNIADVKDRFDYNDTGKRYRYEIDGRGQIRYTESPGTDNPVWRELPLEGVRFDMITASGNRLLAKQADSFRFWFLSPRFEYDHHVQPRVEIMRSENPVPGFFIRLNPEYRPVGVSGPWWNTLHYDHPSLGELFSLAPLLNSYLTDMRMVRVGPEEWHEVFAVPPCGSGSPPSWLRTYTAARYEVNPLWTYLIPEPLPRPGPVRVDQSAIRVYKVLDIALGFTHRHAHYEDTVGGEMDHPQSMVVAPSIIDRAGFYDGTCNFFALCRLQVKARDHRRQWRDSYGILWTDEQTYFSDRWRVLHPDDSNWHPARAGKPLYDLLMQGEGWPYYEDWGPKAWCPFKSAGNYFDDTSRMAVAKQVVLVTGPDPKYEGQSLIHSMNFSWGSRDHTWRWRRCGPQDAISAQGRDTGHDHIVFPGTIRIRDDMTILVEGLAREYEGYRFPTGPVRGWWYQKYLPADNWEVPAPEYCEKDQMPPVGYTHPWRFITDRNLMLADNFSHFGTYDSVNSRSQFCTISGPYVRELGRSLSPEEFADLFPEDTQWEDIEDRLRPDSLFEPRITLKIAKRLLPVPFGGRQFGLIAMHWDKRNDDLAPLYEAGSPIVLQSKGPHQDGAPSRIEISISKHYRKWSPPVVQKAEIDVDMQGRKIIISFQSILKLEHRSDSLDRGKVRRVPRRQGPDRSIWRVKMYAFDKEGKPVLLFNKDTSEFTDAGDYTFKHEWLDTQNDANGKPLGWDNLVTNYLSPQGRIDSALSIVFEDLVGHVATPESVIFVPRSRISQRPGRSLP